MIKRASANPVVAVGQRKWKAYVQNEAMVFFLLGSLGFVSFAILRDDLANRISTLLTLLLAMVAQKYSIVQLQVIDFYFVLHCLHCAFYSVTLCD